MIIIALQGVIIMTTININDMLAKYDKKSVQIMKDMYKEKGIKSREDRKIKKIIEGFYADKENGWDPEEVVKIK